MDFLKRHNIDYAVISGHPNPDKDSVVASFTLCEVVLGLSWEDERVIFVNSEAKGEAFSGDRFYDYHNKRWILLKDKNEKSNEIEDDGKVQTETMPVRRPLRFAVAVHTHRPRTSGIICNTGEDNRRAGNVLIDQSRVLIFNVDTGFNSANKNFDPFTEEKFQAGQRVFFYNHHPARIDLSGLNVEKIAFVCQSALLEDKPASEIKATLLSNFDELKKFNVEITFVDNKDLLPCFSKNTLVLCINLEEKFDHFDRQAYQNGQRIFHYPDWSATGLIFRTHQDIFLESDYYEHYCLMAVVVDANDFGKRFDGRDEYKLTLLFGLGEFVTGLNYNQVHPRSYYRSLQGAFLAIEAFLSNRIMAERNLNEVKKGCFRKCQGVRLFVHDFSNSGINGETIRRFLQGPPYIPGKEAVDCIITSSFDRKQIAICNRELKKAELLDTAEILAKLLKRFPELNYYKDHRGFLLSFQSDMIVLRDLEEVVIELIEERKETFIALTAGALIWIEKIREKIKELSSIASLGRRRSIWKAFFRTVPDEFQELAERELFAGISSDENEAGGESEA